MKTFTQIFRLLLASCACLIVTTGWSKTEVNVQTAGTLSSLISTSEKELKVTGVINGSDIKFIRQLINSGKVTILDWSEVSIVAGGEAYYESYTTAENTIGEKMFIECSGLQQMTLPSTLRKIQGDAFKQTGLTSIDIPSSVREILNSAFCYCNSLSTVVIGENVTTIDGGLFWGSNVKEVYMKPINVPNPSKPAYLFSSSPKIYVYSEALSDYRKAGWNEYGTLYGTLENYYPRNAEDDSVSELCQDFFEDAACTQLKAEYQQVSDEELTTAFTQAGMPEYMVAIALKIKNDTWAAYEKEFRIHSYKAYSDAQLPLTITKIGESAFDRSGLKSIVIPDKVTSVGVCAFSSCDLLTTVVIGKKVNEMGRGCFWGSGVKDVYAQPLTPPSVSDYLFGSKPTIHVYASALEAYQNSRWAEFDTIVGDLTDDIVDGIQPPSISPEGESTEAFPREPWVDGSQGLDGAFFDLMGRKVTNMKPGSIYIRKQGSAKANGKKILFGKH